MKNLWKKLLCILLAVWPYLFVVALGINSKYDIINEWLFRGYVILSVVVFAANIVSAWSDEEDCYYKSAFRGMMIKVAHIPFYLAVFCLAVVYLFMMVIPALGAMVPFIIYHFVLVDLFLMVTSSMYGVSVIMKAKKRGLVSTRWANANIAMHFLFVIDLISAAIVYIKMKSIERSRKIKSGETGQGD